MLQFQYILLHFSLIILLFFSCWKIDTVKKMYYWRYAAVPIIFFALEEGLRWGRALDWCFYYDEYYRIKEGVDTGHEPLFIFLWGIFAKLGFPYPIVITFCSALLIYSGFYLFRPYQGFLRFIIPIWVLITAPWAINVIRWFMGLSFLFIATRSFLDGRKIWFLFFLCSVFTHYGMALFLPVFFLLRKNKMVLKPWFVVVICLLLLLLFDPSLLGSFSFMFDYLSLLSVRFEHYTDNAEGWLSGEVGASQTMGVSLLHGMIKLCPYLLFVFFSYVFVIKDYFFLKKNNLCKFFLPFYNVAAVGCMLKSISFGLELLIRYTFYFEMSFAFLCAYMLFSIITKIKENKMGKEYVFASLVLSFFIIWKIISFCKPMFPYEDVMGYVWNETKAPSLLWVYYGEK